MESQLGTAGGPMLSILQKKELLNTLVIVTRYFGGILLGTGGLVKAYSEAEASALEDAQIIEKESGYIAEIVLEYGMQGEFEYFCENNNIKIVSKEYSEKIKNLIEISEEKYLKTFKEKFQNMPIVLKENKYILKA